MRLRPLLASAACAAVLAACDSPKSTVAPAASAAPSAPSRAATGAASSPPVMAAMSAGSATSAPASSAKLPGTKEFDATPSDQLGKLPPGIGIPVGQKAPDATVRDASGAEVRLSELIKKGPILLAFYRGGWCPYCNTELHAFATAYPEYQRRGVTPVAVSVDTQEEASKTAASWVIPFPVLSDPDLHALEAYKVVHKADDAEYAKLKGYGLDLERVSGKTHHSIAVPSLFLIDKTGIVRWAHAEPEYKVRPKTAQILAAIDAALAKP